MTDTASELPTNIPAPVLTDVPIVEPDVTLEDKVDYIYRTLQKVDTLISSIGPDQIAQVGKLAGNPLMAKLMGGIVGK